jgi:hypothetical protein
MICEQSYFNFVEWINDHNKSCSSWEVMNICNWKFLFETIYFFRIWFQYYFPSSRKKVHGKKTFLLWAVLGKIACCRRPRKSHELCREPLSAIFFYEPLYLPWVFNLAVGKTLFCREPQKISRQNTGLTSAMRFPVRLWNFIPSRMYTFMKLFCKRQIYSYSFLHFQTQQFKSYLWFILSMFE